MKKLLLLTVLFFCFAKTGAAADKGVSYAEEMYMLGAISGEGLACKSQKYHQFELLARAILVGKAANSAVQEEGLRRFSEGKVNAFINAKESNFANCPEIIKSFESQKIFKSVLYSDGRIKLYDGTLITPRQPYDASKLYVKDREAFLKMDALYQKSLAEVQKNAQNMKKVPLKDARYEAYAKQFGN